MKEGIAGHRATGARIGHPYFLCTLAKACLQAGRLEEAQDAVERLRERWPEPVYRLLLTGPWPPYDFVQMQLDS